MDENELKQEYQDFLVILKEHVKEMREEQHKLRVENRKLRSFIKSEFVSLRKDLLNLRHEIDSIETDGEELREPVELDSYIF